MLTLDDRGGGGGQANADVRKIFSNLCLKKKENDKNKPVSVVL